MSDFIKSTFHKDYWGICSVILYIKDAINEKSLEAIKKLLINSHISSASIYEADGTLLSSTVGGSCCTLLNGVSCSKKSLRDGNRSCQEDFLKISRESIDLKHPVERECPGGIHVYAVPIIYEGEVIGSINAGITLPPLKQGTPDPGEMDAARMQIRTVSELISSLYSSKAEHLKVVESHKKQVNAVIENISDGLLVFDGNGRYIMLNKAARRILFPSSDPLSDSGGRHFEAEYYDESGNMVNYTNIPLQRVLRGEKFSNQRMYVRFPHRMSYVEMSGTPVYDIRGNFVMGIICSRDVTEHVDSEILIEDQKSQMEAIIENMSDALVITDSKGRFVLMNAEAREFFQPGNSIYHSGNIYKTRYMDKDGNDIPLDSLPIPRALRGEKVKDFLMTVKRGDKKRIADVSAVPVYNQAGSLSMVIAYFREISRHLEYQNRILLSEKKEREALEKAIKLKDEFLSLVSHEFKTPLTVIISAIQAMDFICRDTLPDKARGFVDKIRQNTYRQLRLVNNLLDITRINAGQVKNHKKNTDIVFLTRSITESVHPYAQQKGIKLVFTSTFGHKLVGLDDEKYERVILNLLSNAIKFTPEGKTITVRVCSRKSRICIEVKDSGIGIPEENLQMIFERFGQVDSSLSRQAEGTGIGLSLVKLFVEAMEGSISVKSELGKGSTFSVMLPSLKVKESDSREISLEQADKRLIQAIAIEFSDIYF